MICSVCGNGRNFRVMNDIPDFFEIWLNIAVAQNDMPMPLEGG
jgi:hypothetical protein